MPSAIELLQPGFIGEALDGGPMLVFIADDRMRYVAVNRLAAETLGYTREELLALKVTDVARSEETPAEYAELIARGARTGRATLTRKDGSEVCLRYRASRTTIDKLEFWVSVGFVEDQPG